MGFSIVGLGAKFPAAMGDTSDSIKLPLGQIAVTRIPASAVPGETQQRAARGKASMRGRLLGEILVAHGRLDGVVLGEALRRHTQIGGRLSELLVNEGHISPTDVIRALSEQSGLPYVSEARIARMPVPTEAIALLPAEKAERLQVLPVALRGRELVCAVPEPRDLALLDELKFLAGVPAIRGVFATTTAIRLGQRRFYHGEAAGEGWESLTSRGGEARSALPVETPWPAPNFGLPAMPPWVTQPTPAAPPMLYPVAAVVAVVPAPETPVPQPFDAALAATWREDEAEVELLDDADGADVVLLAADVETADVVLLDAASEIFEGRADEVPPGVLRLREQMLALLLEQRAGVGKLPSLVRRLALRLGATAADVERVAAAAEAMVLLAPAGTCSLPAAGSIEAALGESGAACSDLFAALGSSVAIGDPAASAFVTGVAWVEAAANDQAPAAILHDLEADPRLPAAALRALGAEVAPPLPPLVEVPAAAAISSGGPL